MLLNDDIQLNFMFKISFAMDVVSVSECIMTLCYTNSDLLFGYRTHALCFYNNAYMELCYI